MIYGGFPSQEKALRNVHVHHKRNIMLNCAEYGNRVAQFYNISDDGTVSVAIPNQKLEKDIDLIKRNCKKIYCQQRNMTKGSDIERTYKRPKTNQNHAREYLRICT